MRVIAAGILGDKPAQCGTACLQHSFGIEPVLQERQRQAGPQIWQHALKCGRGPSDQIEEPAFCRGDVILQTGALFGQALEGMALGGRDMKGIKPGPAKARNGCQDLSIGQISLGVLRQVAAQGFHPFALDPCHLDLGIREAMGNGKPAHAGWLHDSLHTTPSFEIIQGLGQKTV